MIRKLQAGKESVFETHYSRNLRLIRFDGFPVPDAEFLFGVGCVGPSPKPRNPPLNFAHNPLHLLQIMRIKKSG